MAAGRGQFFCSLVEGLERINARQGPDGRQQAPGRGRGRGRRNPDAADPTSASRCCRETKTRHTAYPRQIKTSPPQENLIERLPPEILLKICSYLDASSLICISHVSRLFNKLANEDHVWQKMYMSDFGSWKPKMANEAALTVEPVEVGDLPTGDPPAVHWKRFYFRTAVGNEMNKWSKWQREVCPYTGLCLLTEQAVRKLNISWELTVFDRFGQKTRLKQDRVFFFESSVVVRWRGNLLPDYRHISNMQLHGVRKHMQKSTKEWKFGWRSLISELDMKTQRGRSIGKDRLINLMHLSPGFIVGIWRGQDSIAFIMVSLHFHKLVEKSLLGTPVCPYIPPMDNLHSEFSLHNYTVHFVLHNTATELFAGHFPEISCCISSQVPTPRIRDGLLELIVIDTINVSHHRTLGRKIDLTWTSEELEGSVENCCIITLTLLDDEQKPLWCVSSPICIQMAMRKLSCDYSGEHFLMEHHEPEGQVKMKLVWLKEQKLFFLISLIVYISVSRVNRHFSTEH